MHARRYWFVLVGFVSLPLIVTGCQTPSEQGTPGTPNTRFNRGPAPRPMSSNKTSLATTEQPVQGETHLAAGRLHESQGSLGQAAEQYQAAVVAAPNSIEARERLASVFDRLSKFKESEKEYLQAIKLAPNSAYLQNNFGFSYIMQRRWKDAEIHLRKAVAIKPDFPRARVNLALALAQQEKFDEALANFEMALPAEDAYFNIGLMYQSKRKPVEAAKAYKMALQLNPNMTAARNHLKALPTEALSKADDLLRSEAVASPMPKDAAPKAVRQQNRPASQPAADLNTSIAIEPCEIATGQQDLVHPIPHSPLDLAREESLFDVVNSPAAAALILCGKSQPWDWAWVIAQQP